MSSQKSNVRKQVSRLLHVNSEIESAVLSTLAGFELALEREKRSQASKKGWETRKKAVALKSKKHK